MAAGARGMVRPRGGLPLRGLGDQWAARIRYVVCEPSRWF